MTMSMLDFIGIASNQPLTARSAGWIMIGHAIHHLLFDAHGLSKVEKEVFADWYAMRLGFNPSIALSTNFPPISSYSFSNPFGMSSFLSYALFIFCPVFN